MGLVFGGPLSSSISMSRNFSPLKLSVASSRSSFASGAGPEGSGGCCCPPVVFPLPP